MNFKSVNEPTPSVIRIPELDEPLPEMVMSAIDTSSALIVTTFPEKLPLIIVLEVPLPSNVSSLLMTTFSL